MEAVCYIGHGSRTEQGNKAFVAFIKGVMSIVDAPIQEYGFMELAEPSIPDAIEKCVNQGATVVKVMPVLLLPGIHANFDIPSFVEKARKKYPDVTFLYGTPLAGDDLMLEVFHDRLQSCGAVADEKSAVLLVGHGSRDNQAAEAFMELASNYRKQSSFEVHVGYLKMTEPFFGDVLEEMLKSEEYTNIYVLPFLLFTGGFAEQIKKVISYYQEHYETKVISQCDPVGFDEKLQLLLKKRVLEVRG
ncbi:sirohydrochlorin chelatase [Bacillus salinus]|uniref:sirohydrochlorin chelatase n=1 Tax=Bacillus sp. HMF5848 TaxID=2495421 RepID=UPI00163A83CD|nr:sirohydrochlorin chelatase [Bacillus sp. HMF5848]